MNPQQFFHGSRHADLQPGDFIEPGAKVGKRNYDYDNLPLPTGQDNLHYLGGHARNHLVYMAPSERGAWRWGSAGDFNDRTHSNGVIKRVTVYKVEPQSRPEEGEFDEFTTNRAKVLQRIDIPPPNSYTAERLPGTSDGGVQGELAGQDFGKYQDKPRTPSGYDGWRDQLNLDPKYGKKENPNQQQFSGMGNIALDRLSPETEQMRRNRQENEFYDSYLGNVGGRLRNGKAN